MFEDDDMRALFFEDFGEPVTITPNGGTAREITAIFDARPVDNPVALSKAQVGFKDGSTNTGFSPQVRCRTSDVEDVKAGRATLVARGVTYNVWDTDPDGTGVSTLILKKNV